MGSHSEVLMFVPVWVVVVVAVVVAGVVAWLAAFLRGRNPLPFPDLGSRIFTTLPARLNDFGE